MTGKAGSLFGHHFGAGSSNNRLASAAFPRCGRARRQQLRQVLQQLDGDGPRFRR